MTSEASTSPRTFHWADYLLFTTSIAVTIAVGVAYAIMEKWSSQNAESYLLGDRKMNAFLNAISFLATALSSTFIVGIPAEFYYFGIEFAWFSLGICLTAIYTGLITIPKFRNMGCIITSGYEYFERRYSLPLRMLVAFFYVLFMILSLSVMMYGPSVTFAQVTGQHILVAIAVASAANLIYTSFGGIRAIVVVDNIQMYILLVGVIVLGAVGSQRAGGVKVVYEAFVNGSRTNWDDIRPEPWQRQSVWNLVFLGGFSQAANQGAHQMFTQRYLNVDSLKKAQLSQVLLPPLAWIVMLPILFTAMAAYALFGQCEPLLTGRIEKADQLLSLTILEVLGDIHGVPGLIVAAVFAAALSTLSSGLNALSAVLMEDFIRPSYKMIHHNDISVASAGKIVRYSSFLMGVLVWALSMAVPYMGQTLTTLARSVQAILVSPIFGLFFVGFFFPFVETWGAFIGYICSSVLVMIIFVGSLFFATKVGFEPRPLSVAGCSVANTTAAVMATTPANLTETASPYFMTTASQQEDIEPNIFDLSYTWYTFVGTLVVVIVSVVVSPIVHCIRHRGRPNWKKICQAVDRNLLYTTDDFYFAIGRTQSITITKDDGTMADAGVENGEVGEKYNMTTDADLGQVNIVFDPDHKI